MAGRIPQQFIDHVIARTDIVAVIEERITLKGAGRDYKACCPFHNEKTPSFTVSAEKQFYHCFGCGAHGSVVGFLMEYAGLDFIEAIHELADRLGVEVPRDGSTGTARENWTDLYRILDRACAFYREQLRSNVPAVKYLKGRGLDGSIAAEFAIGYAPPAWDSLLRAFGNSKEARELLVRAGLVTRNDEGRTYDRFRDRIIFPIHGRRGQVLGFGGRALSDGTPKYLNSPETSVFHKGRELYGLFQLNNVNRKPERVLVVEGYMDVVALAQYDIRYTVATLGTASTTEQAERLFRTTHNVIFCFDGDPSGRKAAWRALETVLPLLRDGRSVGFMFLPEGEDPDSLVRELGREAFSALIENASSLTAFLFDQLLVQTDVGTLEGRARLVELAKPLLNRLPDGALQQLTVRKLGDLVGMGVDELSPLVKVRKNKRKKLNPTRAQERRNSPSLVRTIIRMLLHQPGLVSLADNTERLKSLDRAGVPLLVKLLEFLAERPDVTTGEIVEHFRSSEEGRHLAKLAAWNPPLFSQELEREFVDSMSKLERTVNEQRYRELSTKSRVGPLSEEEKQEYRTLLMRFASHNGTHLA